MSTAATSQRWSCTDSRSAFRRLPVISDGTADLIDLITLQKFVHGLGSLPEGDAADLLQDGVVDVFDLAMLKYLLLQKA